MASELATDDPKPIAIQVCVFVSAQFEFHLAFFTFWFLVVRRFTDLLSVLRWSQLRQQSQVEDDKPKFSKISRQSRVSRAATKSLECWPNLDEVQVDNIQMDMENRYLKNYFPRGFRLYTSENN